MGKMAVIHTVAEFRKWRKGFGAEVAGFVPTMGALHEGHISLVRQARARAGKAGLVVSSIFVNPTQFGPSEDFGKYPRTLESDCAMLEGAGCDGVFVPSAEEMYGVARGEGSGVRSETAARLNAATQGRMVTVDAGELGTVLEGAIRPGHFRGVCTVVAKLLNIVQPTEMLMGQKDYQQQAILRRMVEDLNMPVEVVTCATWRETDGLAMSSRNRYLSAEERGKAPVIFAAMMWAKGEYGKGVVDAEVLESGMRERIEGAGLVVQYAVVADGRTLEVVKGGRIGKGAVILVAAKLGSTRLIDNLLMEG